MAGGGSTSGIGAGGFAQGFGQGASLLQSIQAQQQQGELIKLREEQQAFQQEQQLKEQKLRMDQLKLQVDQRKKSEELQQKFFENLGLSASGGAQAGQQGSPASAGAPSGATPPGNSAALLAQAAQAGQLPAFNAAVDQGFIQTPAGQLDQSRQQQSLIATQIQGLMRAEQLKQLKDSAPFLAQQAGLDLEKTRAEIRKIDAQTRAAERDPSGKLPTRASLALQAANGDPKEALELLRTDRQGLSVEVGKDGEVSITTGKPSQKLFNDSIKGISELEAAKQPLLAMSELLRQDPTAASVQGQLRVLATTLKSNVGSFQAGGPKGKEIQERIRNSEDVSQFEFLGEMAAFSVAAMNNPGGRISDADVASARKSLGLPTSVFERPPAAELIVPRIEAALELISTKQEVHRDVIRLMEGGQVKRKSGEVIEPANPPTPAAPQAQVPATPQSTAPAPAPQVQQIPPAALPEPAAQPATPPGFSSMTPKAFGELMKGLTQTERGAILQSLPLDQLERLLKD